MERGDLELFQHMLSLAKPNASQLDVLEIGFGDGRFLSFCKQQGYNAVGNELNDRLMHSAANAGFEVANWNMLIGKRGQYFDLIAAFDVLEHIRTPDIDTWLKELRALLKNDGRILLRFPNGDSWHGLVNFNGDPTHVNPIGYYKLKYYADTNGFEIVMFRGETLRGFETSLAHGFHKLLTSPLRFLMEKLTKLLYFPGSPIVIGRKNVVAVLKLRKHGSAVVL